MNPAQLKSKESKSGQGRQSKSKSRKGASASAGGKIEKRLSDEEARSLETVLGHRLMSDLVQLSIAGHGTVPEQLREAMIAYVEAWRGEEAAPIASTPAPSKSPAQSATPRAKGWAGEHGFRPGDEAEVRVSGKPRDEYLWSALPGLPGLQARSQKELIGYLALLHLNSVPVLAREVLPKLSTAYDVAEFAEFLWAVKALCQHDDDDGGPVFGDRTDLPFALSGDRENLSLLVFLADVVCLRAREIQELVLPKVSRISAADLAEALAIAERVAAEHRGNRLAKREARVANATALERQAWEAKARAWLWRDLWDYDNRELMRRAEEVAA